MRATFSRKFGAELLDRLSQNSRFNFALVMAGLAAIVHVVGFMIDFIAFRNRIESARMVIVDWDPSFVIMHLRIGLALIISVIALFSRRMLGLMLSVLASAWVVGEYLRWYVWSKGLRVNTDIERFPTTIANTLSLYGARPWNVIVFVLTIVVLLYEAKLILRDVKLRP